MNRILGLAAVAGAAYLFKSDKGKMFLSQSGGHLNDLYIKGQDAFKDLMSRVNKPGVSTNFQ